ncbi:hypothetical protein F5883DRAFT_722633 [Diaporthe sp. PMI_573]|nr:hypothetical protein F5883DRAFT_722633 [Diaporthaceae sp. PMI_573]
MGCEILPAGRRFTHNGNLKAGTFLVFNGPSHILEEYPDNLSSESDEEDGIPLLLSTFSMEARLDTLEVDWEGNWFGITARVCPNRLTFENVDQDGWEPSSGVPEPVQYALAMPRDDGLEPIVPRCLSNSASGSSWPTRPAQASFAGPVDHESFQLRGDVWPDLLRRTSVFVKLGSYIIPEGDRAPHKGVHVCHVLVLFPINKQPWSSALSWMKSSSS